MPKKPHFNLGKKHPFRKRVSIEVREQMRQRRLGKKWTKPQRDRMEKLLSTPEYIARISNSAKKSAKKGEYHHRWKKNRELLNKTDKQTCSAFKDWRRKVKERDNNSCKLSSNECGGKIEVHHILNWKDYPELRYQVTNGITLCHAHHPRGRVKEKRLASIFRKLVSVS